MKANPIYFDNAATSWPKPACVSEAVQAYLNDIGANPGRSGHRASMEGGRIVYAAREAVAGLVHAPDPLKVVFTKNVTEALNLALLGLLRAGDHVVTSGMEHNAMMRPLRHLEKSGVQLSVLRCNREGFLDPDDIRKEIRRNTRMIALNHASNVTGTIQPLREVGKIAREHDLLFLVDTAQTAGAYPLDMSADFIDLLGFTGHKSLYGLPGTGGLVIGDRVDLSRFDPLYRGGTGSRSEHEVQPDFLPDKFESGTLNFVGLAALKASIDWLNQTGLDQIRHHEKKLTQILLNALSDMDKITIFGPKYPAGQTSTISFTIENHDSAETALLLEEKAGVLCRVGLHCAPAAHRTIGTFPQGTIRFGLGYFNSEAEIDQAVAVIRDLV